MAARGTTGASGTDGTKGTEYADGCTESNRVGSIGHGVTSSEGDTLKLLSEVTSDGSSETLDRMLSAASEANDEE